MTAGYAPVLVFANAKTADRALKYNGYSAFQVGADMGFPSRLALGLGGGLLVFPDARRRLDEEHDYPTDRSPALTPALQGGLSLELVWFP